MELGAGVAEALLASAESAEVLSGLGDDIVVEGEVDAAGAGCERGLSARAFLHRCKWQLVEDIQATMALMAVMDC